MKEVFLLPGQIKVIIHPGTIQTILGSCVAVALYDVTRKIAGLNHFVLPIAPTQISDTLATRYGNVAIPSLLSQMLSFGALKESIQAKIFGGAAVVGSLSKDFAIGSDNIHFARSCLGKMQLPLIGESTGGLQGRKIKLSTIDFNVSVSFINVSNN